MFRSSSASMTWKEKVNLKYEGKSVEVENGLCERCSHNMNITWSLSCPLLPISRAHRIIEDSESRKTEGALVLTTFSDIGAVS